MAPSFHVRQTIRKGPPRLLRALVAPRSTREAAIAAWTEAELQQEEQGPALVWIQNNREQILAGAIDEPISARERWAQHDEDAQAAVARLNRVYEECQAESTGLANHTEP
jgi:hypothetical protein